ncbi:MAG: class I SAM-dependent methyltransferase [Thermoleophilia bacterium]|nr:class I SAM-dependent methyltransferase [Thermoleophilia bacterium]
MTRVHPVAAAGFACAADVYDRARPSYPEEAVAWMAQRTGLGPGQTVVDVGAGTGKLTRLLRATGARVLAVEPVAEMRAKLDGLDALDGTAEDLPLEDAAADVITAAQAFHWFDLDRALPELHRVLRPGGHLALFWNSRDLDDPVQRGVEDLLRPVRGSVASQLGGAWREPLRRSPLFGAVEERSFRYEQQFTADDLCDRVASTSFVAAMRPVEREEILVRVRALTHGLAEPFPFPYKTEVFVITRSSDRDDLQRGTSI